MRILGYVSDEMYVAIPEALVELESPNGTVTVLRSSPRGALYGELPDGAYRVTLSKQHVSRITHNVVERFLHD